MSAFKQLLWFGNSTSEASPAARGGRYCRDTSKLGHSRRARQLQSKRYAKSIARRLCFQPFPWRRTARPGGNTGATVSDRFEMPAPTPAEFLLDQLLPSAKSGLLGASGPTAKRCFHIMNTSSNPAQRRHEPYRCVQRGGESRRVKAKDVIHRAGGNRPSLQRARRAARLSRLPVRADVLTRR